MVASRSLFRPSPNLLYTPRERPVMAQRLRWRAGEESRGSFCSFTAASILSSKLAVWLLTVFFSASRRAANFFTSLARFVSRLTIEVFAIVFVLSDQLRNGKRKAS